MKDKSGKAGSVAAEPAAAAGGEAEDEEGEGTGGTIYVKNLAFATTDAALKKHFDKVRASCSVILTMLAADNLGAPVLPDA
jgi:hypothetical protein